MTQKQLIEIDQLSATIPDENGNPTDRLRPGCTSMFDENGQKHYYALADVEPVVPNETKPVAPAAASQSAPAQQQKKKSHGNAILFAVFGCIIAFVLWRNIANRGKNASSASSSTYYSSSSKAQTRVTYNSSKSSSSSKSSAADPESVSFGVTKLDVSLFQSSIGTPWIKVVFEMTNTGTSNIYLSSGSYDIEDEDGNIIDTHTLVSEFPGVLAPGEKGYLFDCTLYDGSVDDKIVVVPHVSAEIAKVDLVRFDVSGESLSADAYGDLQMHGRVTNTTDETQKTIYVAACIYDKSGKCLGVLLDLITQEVKPGESIGFEAACNGFPKTISPEDVDHYTVYAYPYALQF